MTAEHEVSEDLDAVERIYRFWGHHPRLYAAQDYVTFLGRPHEIRRRAVDVLELEPGDTVLEVACGSGRNFPYLQEAIGPQGSLVGVDYSREMLATARKLCRRRGWNNVELLQRNAADLQLPDASFDGVLCVLGVSAIPEWTQALIEAHRVLQPGARLSVCDARPFQTSLTALNPAVEYLYSRLAGWDPSRDIPAKMDELFGAVRMETFNLGTFFVGCARRRSSNSPRQ